MRQRGFTIVELLIAIIVIAVIASITLVAYNGVQAKGRTSKIKSDLEQLQKVIMNARNLSGMTLTTITTSGWTASGCVSQPSGTDLAALPKSDPCWGNYATALDKISIASGTNIRGLVDPYGRPYLIDENEQEGGNLSICTKDVIGSYPLPFVTNNPVPDNKVDIPNFAISC